MKIEDAILLCKQLMVDAPAKMNQPPINGQVIVHDSSVYVNGRYTLAYVQVGQPHIYLNGPVIERNDESKVRRVLLHEIAHILVPGAGHTMRWQIVCKAIGGDGHKMCEPGVYNLPFKEQAAFEVRDE